jgi:hypothetical protein
MPRPKNIVAILLHLRALAYDVRLTKRQLLPLLNVSSSMEELHGPEENRNRISD